MTQKDLFLELIKNDNPNNLNTVWNSINVFEWNDNEKPVVTVQDIVSILDRYVAGVISEKQVEDWADLIEAADVALGGICEENIMSVISILANPETDGNLNKYIAQELLDKINC